MNDDAKVPGREKPSGSGKGPPLKATREARLAAALKSNLARRKAAAREAAEEPGRPADGEAEGSGNALTPAKPDA